MFQVDSSLSKVTEKKKEIILLKHENKLKHLKSSGNLSNQKSNSCHTVTAAERENKITQSAGKTQHSEKRHQPSNKRNKTNRDSQKTTLTKGSANVHSLPRHLNESGSESVSNRTQTSKNDSAPGTKMTYAEALKAGAQKETVLSSIQTTLDELTKAVATLVKSDRRSAVGLYGSQTRKHGGRENGGPRRYRRGRDRC